MNLIEEILQMYYEENLTIRENFIAVNEEIGNRKEENYDCYIIRIVCIMCNWLRCN